MNAGTQFSFSFYSGWDPNLRAGTVYIQGGPAHFS